MIAARFTKAVPCLRTPVPKRAVVGRAAAPESSDQTPEAEKVVDPTVNPVTGNPQTGKLIDVYFEVGSFLVVVAVAFASMWNVKDVVNQTSSADSLRQPASKAEWVAMDNQNVYGPCGGAQGSAAAMEDLLEGKACVSAEYSRAAPKGVM